MLELAAELRVVGASSFFHARLHGQKAGCVQAIFNAAKGVIAGTVSLAAFADVLVAVLSVLDLAGILVAAGIAIGVDLIYQYVKCMAS